METLLLNGGLFLLKLVGGAAALETFLENYIMDKVPQWAKGLVVPLVGLVFAVVANLQLGMDLGLALTTALSLWGTTALIHNNPKTTSADISDWAPPADALGVPAPRR